MITKNKLQSIISKYYLGGKVESVKWKVKDGKLDIDFMAPTKDMIGKVVFKGMPLEDSIIAISNTTQLNKLIGITNGYLELKDKVNTLPIYINRGIKYRFKNCNSQWDIGYNEFLQRDVHPEYSPPHIISDYPVLC